jgi:hypothetical protein
MSRNSIYKLIREGKLKPSSPCGRRLIAREQLVKLLADSEGKESPSGRGHNAKAAIEARWSGKKTAVAAKRQAAK